MLCNLNGQLFDFFSQLVTAKNILRACATAKQGWMQEHIQTYRGQSTLAQWNPTNLLKHINGNGQTDTKKLASNLLNILCIHTKEVK